MSSDAVQGVEVDLLTAKTWGSEEMSEISALAEGAGGTSASLPFPRLDGLLFVTIYLFAELELR